MAASDSAEWQCRPERGHLGLGLGHAHRPLLGRRGRGDRHAAAHRGPVLGRCPTGPGTAGFRG
jgi:hypothetical protein